MNERIRVDVSALLARLTIDEKAHLTAGLDMWTVPGLPEHGIPSITVTDGPNGARGASLLGTGSVSAVCVPCGSALGATWDPALVQQVGEVLGEEARTKSARVLLAPTVNLPRSPLFGRSFECYSEDPLLSGQIAAGFIRGVQSRGVAATVKHLIGNEAEFERTSISSEIDERTLREIYLVPFEHAAAAGAMAVMTSYNRLNGTWCGEDRQLLTDVLRGELGFDGIVMTDWFAVGSTIGSALAGMDLQMPGPDRFFGQLLAAAVRSGDVAEAVLDTIVLRWLTLIDRLDAWSDRSQPERSVELPEHRAVARQAATDSTVLLRNDGLLPLSGRQKIALIGPNAEQTHIMGGGSAQLRAHRIVPLSDVLLERLGADLLTIEPGCVQGGAVRPLTLPMVATFRDAAGKDVGSTDERDTRLLWFNAPLEGLDPDDFSFTAKGVLTVRETGRHLFTLVQAGRARVTVGDQVILDGFADVPPPGAELFGLGSVEVEALIELTAGQVVEVVIDYSSEGSMILHGVKVGYRRPLAVDLLDRAVAAARAADVAVVVVGTNDEWESEGQDRTTLHLPGDQDELVRRVCAANPRTVVVVNAGAPVQMDWAAEAGAIVVPWLGGQEMAEALADVLLGAAEPAGRLPVTFPQRIEHTPAFGAFPGENHRVTYSEGLLTGYRWYTSRQLPTRFPFGHGGSYTSFSWSDPVLPTTFDGPPIVVEVAVTNIGDRRGADVVQVYVEPLTSRLTRPRRELRGFAKVWAEPGETVLARVELPARAFAFYDSGSSETSLLALRLGHTALVPVGQGPEPTGEPGWYVEEGPQRIVVARSAEDDVAAALVHVTWSGRIS